MTPLTCSTSNTLHVTQCKTSWSKLHPLELLRALQAWTMSYAMQSLAFCRARGLAAYNYCIVYDGNEDAGEAFADQVLAVAAAAFKEARVAFAASVSGQAALMPDLVARIRSLLLSTARLSEGELLRRTDDLGPSTAQSAPHKLWRWDLTQDHIAVTSSPGKLNTSPSLWPLVALIYAPGSLKTWTCRAALLAISWLCMLLGWDSVHFNSWQ